MRLSAGLGDRLFRRNRGRDSDGGGGSDPPPAQQDEEATAAAAASPGNGITLREINNASSAVVPGKDNSNVHSNSRLCSVKVMRFGTGLRLCI